MSQPMHQPDLFFPSTVIPTTRSDGGYIVIPGRPVIQEEELTVREVATILRCSPSRVRQLARSMQARQARARGKMRIPASQVALLKERRA